MEFLKNYNNPKNIRFKSFEFALLEASRRNHKTLVETGTTRGKKKFIFFRKINWLDGMSTLIFSDYAKFVNGHFYSCDIEQKNIDTAKKFTRKNSNFITFIKDDSLNFLENFNQKIDFLYLDSLDGQDPNASKHQLLEIQNAENKLHSKSLILLDDKGSKTNLSIDYMLSKKFKIINETENQVLLSK